MSGHEREFSLKNRFVSGEIFSIPDRVELDLELTGYKCGACDFRQSADTEYWDALQKQGVHNSKEHLSEYPPPQLTKIYRRLKTPRVI